MGLGRIVFQENDNVLSHVTTSIHLLELVCERSWLMSGYVSQKQCKSHPPPKKKKRGRFQTHMAKMPQVIDQDSQKRRLFHRPCILYTCTPVLPFMSTSKHSSRRSKPSTMRLHSGGCASGAQCGTNSAHASRLPLIRNAKP